MSICCKLVRALAVVLLAVYATPQELNSTLHSTISGVPVAFANENVVFTCITRGSNLMGWSSDEYIGTGGRRLDFISTNVPGTTRTSGETRAELISASVDQFIISRLYIRIQPTFPIASVKCENIGAGTKTSITFPLADDTSLTCGRQLVCPGDTFTCVCVTGQSNTLIWTSNGNELKFASNNSLNTRRDIPGSSTFAILTENSARNGVRVLMSNLTVSASVNFNNSRIILTCENVDLAMTKPAIIPIDENCPMIQVTTSDGNQNAPAMRSSGDLIVAVIVLVIIAIGVIAIMIIVMAALYLAKYKPLKEECNQKDQEKQTALTTLEQEKDDEKSKEIEALKDQNDQEMKTLTERKDREMKTLTERKDQEMKTLTERKDLELKNLTKRKDQEKQTALTTLAREKDDKKTKEIEALKKQIDEKAATVDTLTKQLESISTSGTTSSHSSHGRTPTPTQGPPQAGSSSHTAAFSHSSNSNYPHNDGQLGRNHNTGIQARYHHNSRHD